MSTIDGAPAPRYGELAGVEHHPQITDFVPRRTVSILAVVAGGAAVASASAALSHSADAIAGALPGVAGSTITQAATGLTAWTTAVFLLTASLVARLIFSLRRHRIEDVRGRYRVWRWISRAALALSVNSVVGVHALVAATATAATGWSLTTGGAEWWLAPAAIVAAWLGIRLLQEVAESRGTVALLAAVTACYGLAAAGALGWSPVALGAWSDVLTSGLPVVGHALALAGSLTFARYVVLDVQELIEHKPRKAANPAAAAPKAPATTATTAQAPAAVRRDPAPATRGLAPESEDDADDAGDESQDGQYLSKAERKRLRKQQRRAA